MQPTFTPLSLVASLCLFTAVTLPSAHGVTPSSLAADRSDRIVVSEAAGEFAATAERLTELLMTADADILLVEAFYVEGLSGSLSPSDAKTIWDCLDDHQDMEGIETSTIRDFKSDFIGGLTDAQVNLAAVQSAKTMLGRLLGEVPVGSFSTGSPVFTVVRSIQYETDPAALVFKRCVSYLVVDQLTGRGLNVFIVRKHQGGPITTSSLAGPGSK